MLHPPEHISLTAIFMACRANKLQWYLGPPPEDKDETKRKPGEVLLPDLAIEKMQGELGALAAGQLGLRRG